MKRKLFTPINIAAVVVAIAFAPKAVEALYGGFLFSYRSFFVLPLEKQLESINKKSAKAREDKEKALELGNKIYLRTKAIYGKSIDNYEEIMAGKARALCKQQVSEANGKLVCDYDLKNGQVLRVADNYNTQSMASFIYSKCIVDVSYQSDCSDYLKLNFLDPYQAQDYKSKVETLKRSGDEQYELAESLGKTLDSLKKKRAELLDKLSKARGRFPEKIF